MLHALPYHNPTVLASVIHTTHILTGGCYEWGVGRGHGWIPPKAGVPLDEHARPRYEEAVDLLLAALDNEEFSHHGEYFDVDHSHVVPFVSTPYRVYLGGTSDRTYTLAAERGWGVAVPPLLPYKVLEQQLDLYRSSCAENDRARHRVDPRLPPRRGSRHGASRGHEWITGFIQGNCSPLTEHPKPDTDGLIAAGYGFYTAGIMEQLADSPYEQLIDEDYVWVGTPEDIVARIEETIGVMKGSRRSASRSTPAGRRTGWRSRTRSCSPSGSCRASRAGSRPRRRRRSKACGCA